MTGYDEPMLHNHWLIRIACDQEFARLVFEPRPMEYNDWEKLSCHDVNFRILHDGGYTIPSMYLDLVIHEYGGTDPYQQGNDCVVPGVKTFENCDCSDPENYDFYDEGGF